VQPKDKVALYEEVGIGGVVRYNGLDGSGRMVYAKGMRNPAGITIGPKGDIWTTDNQVDGLGDDIPPGELNKLTAAGEHFGFPYYNGHFKVAGSAAAPDLADMKEPAGNVFPQVEFPAHQAQLGVAHYTGKAFPAKYQGGVPRPIELGEQGTQLVGTRYQRVPSCRPGQARQRSPLL